MRTDCKIGDGSAGRDSGKKLIRDGEARFAAELGRSVGRLDWWNIRGEHTPYEWALQLALYAVAPFGERRADMREARQTAILIASKRTEPMGADEFHELWKTAANYLPGDQEQDDEEADLDALAAMQGG